MTEPTSHKEFMCAAAVHAEVPEAEIQKLKTYQICNRVLKKYSKTKLIVCAGAVWTRCVLVEYGTAPILLNPGDSIEAGASGRQN